MFAALHQRDLGAIETALAAGADINAVDRIEITIDRENLPAQRTPLLSAVETGDEKVVRRLLAAPGIDLNLDNGFDRTPLMTAAEHGCLGIVQALLSAGASGDTANVDTRSALAFAVEGRHVDVALALLVVGRPPDLDAVLVDAAFRGLSVIVERLLDAGASIHGFDRAGTTPLAGAAWGGRDDVLRVLLARGADLPSEGVLALRLAANSGHASTVHFLAAHGVPLNEPDGNGWTPLISAAWQGHEPTVAALLELGADPRLKDDTGKTASDWASEGGHQEVVRLLEYFNAGVGRKRHD